MQGNETIKNATSILDYIFRELAISYLERNDLAHVDPSTISPDSIGNGINDGKVPIPAAKYISNGYGRSRNDNLFLLPSADALLTGTNAMVTARPSINMQSTAISESNTANAHVKSKNDLLSEARIKGYEGTACNECQNFTMVRNGTCLKCDSCGSTSGCS